MNSKIFFLIVSFFKTHSAKNIDPVMFVILCITAISKSENLVKNSVILF